MQAIKLTIIKNQRAPAARNLPSKYKMVDVVTSIEINHPADKVADYASDPDNVTKWYVNIKSVEWKTLKPLKVGSQITFKAQFLGKELAYVYEVIKNEHAEFVMRTADGPFPMETTYTWEVVEGQKTKMTLRNRGNPSGFKSIFAPFMSMAMRRANKKDLRLLKQILEEKE